MSNSYIWWGIAAYVIVALAVGYMSREASSASSMSEFFIGNRKMKGMVATLSYSATIFSAFLMIGMVGLTYAGGVGALGFELAYFVSLAIVALVGPKFWMVGKKYGYITPSEMLGHRYNSKALAFIAAGAACVFLIPYSAVQLAGVGYLLQGMSDGAISFTTGVIVAAVLAVVFAYVAGIRSVMWTDALQAAVMIVGLVAVVGIVVSEIGGLGTLFDRVAAEQPKALTVPGDGVFSFITFIGITIPWLFYAVANPQVSQRLFMSASLKSMRHTIIGSMLFGLVGIVLAVVLGLCVRLLIPGLEKADLATPVLLGSAHIPPFIGIVMMIAAVGAAVSTIDSIILTLSSMVARDIYANTKAASSESAQLNIGKWVVPVIAIMAVVFAELQLDLIAMLSVASVTGLAVLVPATLGAFYWKRGTALGGIVSVVCTGILVLFIYANGNSLLGLPAGVWSLPLASILFVVVSLFSKKPGRIADEFMAEATRVRFGNDSAGPKAVTRPALQEEA